jgi:hypothetical protein
VALCSSKAKRSRKKQYVCIKNVPARQAIPGKTPISFWFRKLDTDCPNTDLNSLQTITTNRKIPVSAAASRLGKLSLTVAVIVRENSIWHLTYDTRKISKENFSHARGKSNLDFSASVVYGKNTLSSGDLSAWLLM